MQISLQHDKMVCTYIIYTYIIRIYYIQISAMQEQWMFSWLVRAGYSSSLVWRRTAIAICHILRGRLSGVDHDNWKLIMYTTSPTFHGILYAEDVSPFLLLHWACTMYTVYLSLSGECYYKLIWCDFGFQSPNERIQGCLSSGTVGHAPPRYLVDRIDLISEGC